MRNDPDFDHDEYVLTQWRVQKYVEDHICDGTFFWPPEAIGHIRSEEHLEFYIDVEWFIKRRGGIAMDKRMEDM